MSKGREKATLGSARGSELLRSLTDKLKSPTPPAPSTRSTVSPDEELLAAFQRRQPPPLPPTVPAIKKTTKTKKEIIRVPASHRQAFVDAAKRATSVRQTVPSSNGVLNDFGKAAFQKIKRMRNRLQDFNASHEGPASVPPDELEVIRRRIALGAAKVAGILNPDDGHFIGYDFGTSSTKAVLRHPYKNGSDFAVSVPPGWASGGQPHLWPTALWYDQATDRFSAVPALGWRCLQGFKSAIIEGHDNRNCCGAPVTMAEAATAFTALHVAYVVGAALEHQPELKVAGINFGVPVAALANTRTRSAFEQIANVGLSLVPLAARLSATQMRAVWTHEAEPVIPPTFHAELSGAIAGYCASPRYFRGSHMIIDCGSATLDMASFKLGDQKWPVGIYDARVEALGADACLVYCANGATAIDCRDASRHQEHLVYTTTLHHQPPGFEQDEGKFPYQITLIGGGIHSEVHKPLFEVMAQAFHRAFYLPELARDLDYDSGTEAGRLILADGLARSPIELREVAMPRDPPPQPQSRYPPEPPGPEQC